MHCLRSMALLVGLTLLVGSTQPVAVAGEGKKAKLAPLKIDLPIPKFIGTRKDIKPRPTLEKPSARPRPPFLAPEGTRNLALKRPVTSSDDNPIVGDLELVTDGDKEAMQDTYVELAPGCQWVQVDLGQRSTIHAIVVWHFHLKPYIFHDVVVQVADDADFIANVRTLYNNDYDNSSGLGLGRDKEYVESYEGRLIDAKGVEARFVRLYSKDSTDAEGNQYTEVEVYGKPAQ